MRTVRAFSVAVLAWTGLTLSACLPSSQNPLGVSNDQIFSPNPDTSPLNTDLDGRNTSRVAELARVLATLAPGQTVRTTSEGSVYAGSLTSSIETDPGDGYVPPTVGPPSDVYVPSNTDYDEPEAGSDTVSGGGCIGDPGYVPELSQPLGGLHCQLRNRGFGQAFGGVMEGTSAQTLVLEDGPRTITADGLRPISADYDGTGQLQGFMLPSFIMFPSPWIVAGQPGDTQSISGTGIVTYQYDVAIQSRTVLGSTIIYQVKYDLEIRWGAGYFYGTSEHTVRLTREGPTDNSVTYSTDSSFHVFMGAPEQTPMFETFEDFSAEGELPPLP